ncbi:MAG: hypothetical protein GQE15_16695 [Archangiaceae bacterium]|nr:hypothetical protein [Archangiaceae bacterium]
MAETDVLLTDEVLARVLAPPTSDPARCSICSVIGSSAWFVTNDDGEITQDTLSGKAQATSQLVEHLRFGEHLKTKWVVRCPLCSTLYVAELPRGRSFADEGWYRVTLDDLLAEELLRWNRKPGAVLRRRSDGVFVIVAEPRESLSAVLREVRERLQRPGNDFTFSSWENQADALAELDLRIAELDAGNRPDVSILFAPTGPLQEVAIHSGWGDAFLELANRFDAAR